MSEPPANSPSPQPEPGSEPSAEPFEPGPASLGGCSKPAVVGCLVLLALLAVGLILLVSQSPRLLDMLMGQMRGQIVAALPDDLAADERQRLERAFDAATDAMVAGRVDATTISNLQRLSAAVPARGERLSREQVLEITGWLEEIAAVPAPGETAPPPAEPAPVDA